MAQGLELDDLKGPFQPKAFIDSMIISSYQVTVCTILAVVAKGVLYRNTCS